MLEFRIFLSMQTVSRFFKLVMYVSIAVEEVPCLCWSAKAERMKGTLFCPMKLSRLGSKVPPEGSLMMSAPSERLFSAVSI